MKKVLLMAAMICAAMVSQAAAWQIVMQIVRADKPDYGTVYFVNSTDLISLSSAISSAKAANPDSYDLTEYLTAVAGYDFAESAIIVSGAANADIMALKSSVTYTLGAVLLDDATAPTKYMLVTDYKDVDINSDTASWNLEGRAWESVKATPSPEPTSGILLLLGMGALALKRKRA